MRAMRARYTGFVEALRFASASHPRLDSAFPIVKPNALLARLNVSRASGDLDGDGDFDRIDIFGARSVSIRERPLGFDSGPQGRPCLG